MTTTKDPFRGLVAATFTPLNQDGSLNTPAIQGMVDHLVRTDIAGMYVLGSTGEGVSMTQDERRTVAEAFVQAANGRIRVIVQCGCESLSQASQLARHAQEIGADAISAVSPVYFKPDSTRSLVKSMAKVAAEAPDLPFYYYHIPAITGVAVGMLDFLKMGGEQIPTLQGIKYTAPNVDDYQACIEYDGGRFEIMWGRDEMLMSGLTAGAQAAVGSTYNFAAPVYHQLMAAYAEGNLEEARVHQSRSQALVRTFVPYGPRAAQKAIMSMVTSDCGPPRLPVIGLEEANYEALRQDLHEIGFFQWIEDVSTTVRP